MRTLLFGSLVVAACSKSGPPADKAVTTAPPVIEGATAKASDPANLPPAGTAPTPVTVAFKDLQAVWTTPLKTLKGKYLTLGDYKDRKALMLVNVASKCGNTPQYATLEALQKEYESRGFTVVGFPCNQFGGQEPGSSEEISEFCAVNYGITFPITEKLEVDGPNASPIYKALTQIADVKGTTGDIRWNFEKFVVSADGTKVTRFDPRTKPDDPAVIAAVEAALPKK